MSQEYLSCPSVKISGKDIGTLISLNSSGSYSSPSDVLNENSIDAFVSDK